MKTSTKNVMKYVLLPGFLPLMRELTTTGFGYISFFMAQIYGMTRLLPANHPYLNPANRGRFGVRHVVAAAAGNLRFKKENSDQIIVFFLLLTGVVVLFLQLALLGMAVFVQTAKAAMPTTFEGFFVTQAPLNDIAFVLLDRVFGVPDMFTNAGGVGTCVAQNQACFADINPNAQPEGPFPWPFHLALHEMLQLYSIGLLVIAVLIFIYFIFTVVAETAQTGTPFGRRFNHVWAPIRMVVALGLLIPVANGLNAAQYITLYAAKWGSGFATNGWNLFVQVDGADQGALLGENAANLVGTPSTPELTNLLEFNTTLQTCWAAYGRIPSPQVDIQGYLVKDSRNPPSRMIIDTGTTYQDALNFYNDGDILMRFGECMTQDGNDPPEDCEGEGADGGDNVYSGWEGGVIPTCGEVIVPTGGGVNEADNPGAYYIQEKYFELMRDMWLGGVNDPDPDLGGVPGCPDFGNDDPATQMEKWGECIVARYSKDPENDQAVVPDSGDVDFLVNAAGDGYEDRIRVIIQEGVNREIQNEHWADDMRDLGWGGAALWYNKIAEINGALITAASNLPRVRLYPMVLEDIRKERLKANNDVAGRNGFRPYISTPDDMQLPMGANKKIARVLWQAYDLWSDQYPPSSNDAFTDIIHALLGINGLYALRNPANVNIHPLAQLVGLGKTLIETSVRNLGFALAAGFGGGGMAVLLQSPGLGSASGVVASIFVTLAMIALGIGFILFYVVPFLPFVYFFFAVGTWVKGIFEAMVGVPLWALAHIRIDGEGLPGNAAIGGYQMILEIFLRPIVIVFGLLASVVIFGAQVRVLNDIWSLVTSNLTGFDVNDAAGAQANTTGSLTEMRDVVDDFFFTAIYAVVVYMLGMSSFKLINQIPKNVMRWMGASVDAFADGTGDPAEGLVSHIAQGEQVLNSSVTSIMQGVKKAGGPLIKGGG